MKKLSKIVSLAVAAVMAFGVLVAPVEALAQGTTTDGTADNGAYTVTSTKSKTLALTGVAEDSMSKKTLVIGSTIEATGKNAGTYKVTVVKTNAFKGAKATKVSLPKTIKKIEKKAFNKSKAKTIIIKANLKPAKARNMLKGTKAKKVTIKVPAKQVKAWKKYAKAGKLGLKGTKVVIKKI